MQSNEQAMQKAMRLAHSSQGQELWNQLQKNHADTLSQAVNQASRGDYKAVKQILSSLLSDPEAQKLLKELGGQP